MGRFLSDDDFDKKKSRKEQWSNVGKWVLILLVCVPIGTWLLSFENKCEYVYVDSGQCTATFAEYVGMGFVCIPIVGVIAAIGALFGYGIEKWGG